MTPPAARAVIAAHLTDALDLAPHLATLAADDIANRLTTEGWQLTSTWAARPVEPRARETSRARRLAARLRARTRKGTTQ